MPSRRVPSVADRHLLSRFSYGVTPELAARVQEQGGAEQWFRDQLSSGTVADRYANGLRAWFPALSTSPVDLWAADQAGGKQGWQVAEDFERWTMLRRTYSNRQLHETVTEFWANLLHVPCPEPKSWPYRMPYDAAVRRHALGRFDQMLEACILHPGMLLYLDNAVSVASNLNENLGREVLELHTVGVAGGYSEAEVRDSARILTGWRVDGFKTWRAYYAGVDHWRGPVSVVGFQDANDAPDGRALARRYLRHLAHHPVTARRIARRLCVRFVSDEPSSDVVAAVTRAYTESGTDIKASLNALVSHPEFRSSVGAKVRTPTQDALATYRALGVRVRRPQGNDDFVHAMLYHVNVMGQQPFGWVRPDGFPDVADAWTSISRMLGSWQAHYTLAGGYWPRSGASYRTKRQWLPPLPARFDAVVDHISRAVLARPATPALQHAVTTYTTIEPFEPIRTVDDLPDHRLAQLLSVLLDSPAHMRR